MREFRLSFTTILTNKINNITIQPEPARAYY
jgi:hypothetical protein